MNAAPQFDNATVLSPWSVPDMTILNGGRRDPVVMPPDLFGPAWGLLEDIAEGTSSAVDYAAAAFLSCCASLVGGKRTVRPFTTADWEEPCILWAAVVGDPSARKSPPLDVITKPLRAIERDYAAEHDSRLRDFHEKSEFARASKKHWQEAVAKAVKSGAPRPDMPLDSDEPAEPVRRRTMVMDTTPEAVGAILGGNPQGTLHFRDELAGWLTSFDRYSPGGREFWLETYGGRNFVIDRKGAKAPISISFLGVSVLGGIQPAKLQAALLSSVDDGLVPRFLWVWPEKVPALKRPQSLANIDALASVFRRLDQLAWGTGATGELCAISIPLSPLAADAFEEWRRENANVDADAMGLYKSFVGKMEGAVLRLALVGELVRWAWSGGDEPKSISPETLVAAAALVEDYFKPMAERVFGDAALPEVERDAAVLARYLRKLGLSKINLRTLKQSPHKSKLPQLRSGDRMRFAADFLVDANWLLPAPSRDGDTPGRARLDYMVNPAVLGS